MHSILLEAQATEDNFDEAGYLAANPVVAAAVGRGDFRSGRQHFQTHGHREGRRLRLSGAALAEAKTRKLERLRPFLRGDLPSTTSERGIDFLSESLRKQFNIVDTDAVSSNDYDGHVLGLIDRHKDGLVLDCGAGKRARYFDNVINFEIVAYDTTDVRGVMHYPEGPLYEHDRTPNSGIPDGVRSGSCVSITRAPCVGTHGAYNDRQITITPRSQHVGGVQVLMGDGSGRFISENISLTIWQGLGTHDKGEVIGDF